MKAAYRDKELLLAAAIAEVCVSYAESKGISIANFCRRAGCYQSHLRHTTRQKKAFSVSMLMAFASTMKISLSELIKKAEERL